MNERCPRIDIKAVSHVCFITSQALRIQSLLLSLMLLTAKGCVVAGSAQHHLHQRLRKPLSFLNGIPEIADFRGWVRKGEAVAKQSRAAEQAARLAGTTDEAGKASCGAGSAAREVGAGSKDVSDSTYSRSSRT